MKGPQTTGDSLSPCSARNGLWTLVSALSSLKLCRATPACCDHLVAAHPSCTQHSSEQVPHGIFRDTKKIVKTKNTRINIQATDVEIK